MTTDRTTDSQVTDSTTDRTNESTTDSQNTDRTTTDSQESTTTDQPETTENPEPSTTKSPSSGNETCASCPDCPPIEETQNRFICPTGFKRHPSDCNLFYQCAQNTDSLDMSITTFKCPDNTVFDEKACQCKKPDDGDECQNDVARFSRSAAMDMSLRAKKAVSIS